MDEIKRKITIGIPLSAWLRLRWQSAVSDRSMPNIVEEWIVDDLAALPLPPGQDPGNGIPTIRQNRQCKRRKDAAVSELRREETSEG